jgi:fluoride exporter
LIHPLEGLLKNYLFVALGSSLGGVMRYWATGITYKYFTASFPFGTLFVNVAGSFIIGFVMFYLDTNKLISTETKVFLTTGFCGGLTTFSTFSYESVELLKDSEYLLAGTNIVLNLFLTIAAVFIAYLLSKILRGL